MRAQLVIPSEALLPSYLEACREFKERNVSTYRLHDPDLYEEWRHDLVRKCIDQSQGLHLPPGYVPASTFWLAEGDQFIGTGNIRHCLTESLERFGGHIGYAIRVSRWGRGYGTLQLQLLLREAEKLGLRRVLITCNDENIGSARIIEKNGGLHQDTIDNLIDGTLRRTRRYWIDIC